MNDLKLEFVDSVNIAQALSLVRGFIEDSTYFGADEKYVQWLYFDSPFKLIMADEDDYSILVFLDNQRKILDLDDFVSWKTYVNGKAVTSAWDIEWMNFSDIRGLGRELVKALRSKIGIYCGFGMNQLSLKAYEKLGYPISSEIERKIAIINAEKCWEAFGDNQIAGQQEFIRRSEVKPASMHSNYFLINDLKGISEKYWISHLQRFTVTSCKDKSVLKWRYMDHPYIKHYFISLDSEAKTGLAVVRVEKIRARKENVLRVLELFPVQGYESGLTEAVLKFANDQAAILADFFCVSGKYCDQICLAPFLSLSQHREFAIPMLFQPMEVRPRRSINMVLDRDPIYQTVGFDNFYATKGDGDQDIFVNQSYKTVSL